MRRDGWLAAALFLMLSLDALGAAEGWNLIKVPGATNFSGVAWYRAWVKVPDSYFAKHERNLFEESVGVYIRQFAGAYEVWVNGKSIGSGGTLPPNYRSAGEALQRHKVPVGTLRKGAWNEVSVRVYNAGGPGGFVGEAPFIMDYFLECVFAGSWEFRLGDGYKPSEGATNRPPPPCSTSFVNPIVSSDAPSKCTVLSCRPRNPSRNCSQRRIWSPNCSFANRWSLNRRT